MKLNIEKLESRNMACTWGPQIPDGFVYPEPIQLPPRLEQPDGSFIIIPAQYSYEPSHQLPLFAEMTYDAN